MDKQSTTRRAVVAGLAGSPALLSFQVLASESGDAKLLKLGTQFRSIVQELEICRWSNESLCLQLDAVEAEILQIQATTMEGLFVKASAACWALLGDLDYSSKSTTDFKMSLSIIRDLVRRFDPSLEKPGALRELLREIEAGATKPEPDSRSEREKELFRELLLHSYPSKIIGIDRIIIYGDIKHKVILFTVECDKNIQQRAAVVAFKEGKWVKESDVIVV